MRAPRSVKRQIRVVIGNVAGRERDPHPDPDLAHAQRESRFLRIGRAATGRVIIAAYTVRRTGDGETIRIISARRASRRERRAYAADGPLD
jgi:uncharacterized DUF497 family protein